MTDHVQEYLRTHKYPAHLVEHGATGLVRRWKEFVEQVEHGYSLGIEDYRNDLDIRSIIHKAGAEDDAVHALDVRFKKLLTGTKLVWDCDVKDAFWCVGYPKNAGEDLLEDLKREGIAT